ncbi:MAG: hypothetical protein IJ736_08090 [Firmicutes bacterium]|nr:hypothetical protein [Bacillota bacterium]MBR1736959.1 hypothetical protein [Bacillota bacterium]
MLNDFDIHLHCPYENCKGETLANRKVDVVLSIQCSKCKRVYKADLKTCKTEKWKAQKRIG